MPRSIAVSSIDRSVCVGLNGLSYRLARKARDAVKNVHPAREYADRLKRWNRGARGAVKEGSTRGR
jgi:hypothetical protein